MLDNLSILVQAPALNLQLLIDRVLIGAVFALAAYGMALVWGVTNIINLAQGEFVMLGGFIAVACAD
jgi:branched-chain amino acid transport system permease protein